MENFNHKNLLTKFFSASQILVFYDNYFKASLLMNKLCKDTKETWNNEYEAFQTKFAGYKRSLEYTDSFGTKFSDYLFDHQKYLHYRFDILFDTKESYQKFLGFFFDKVPENHRNYLEFKKIQIDDDSSKAIEYANKIYDNLWAYNIDHNCLMLDLEDTEEYSSGKKINYANQIYDYTDSVRKHGNVKEVTSLIICKLEDQLVNLDTDFKVKELSIEDEDKAAEINKSYVSSLLKESILHFSIQEEMLNVNIEEIREIFTNLRIMTVHNRHQSIWYDWRSKSDMNGKDSEFYEEILDIMPKSSEQCLIFQDAKFFYVQNGIFYEGFAKLLKFENMYIDFESQASNNYIYTKQFEIITNCDAIIMVQDDDVDPEIKKLYESNCDLNFNLDYDSEIIFECKNWIYFYYEETSFKDNRWLYEHLNKTSSFTCLNKVHMSITDFRESDLPTFPRGVEVDFYVYLTEITKDILTKISELIARYRVKELDIKFDLDNDEIDITLRPDLINTIWKNINLKRIVVRYYDIKSDVELGNTLRNLNLDPSNSHNPEYEALHKYLTSLLSIDNVKETYVPRLKDNLIIE